MAGSQSFGKRENEKKKRARRLEKQKRREERQAGGPSSFEEMIAYVDENGRIADTLPEKSGREEVRPEDVPIIGKTKCAGIQNQMRLFGG